MTKPLYLYIGRSASGKTTVAELLETTSNYKTLQSYTTRPKRHDNETGHTFVSDEEFDALQNIIAYTEYNGHRYCCTAEQIDASDIYVIDVPGVKTLLEKYQTDRPIVVIYFNAGVRTRIDRMLNRHDCDAAIISRLYNDEEFDWQGELSKVVWHYKNNVGKNVQMHVIDTNQDLNDVLKQVVKINNELEGQI